MTPRTALAACLLLGAASPAAATGEFSSGIWKGEPVFANAVFNYCGMVAHMGEWRVAFTLSRERNLNFGLAHPQVPLARGGLLRASMRIDNGAPFEQTFKAEKRGAMVAFMGPLAKLDALRQARLVSLRIGEITGRFDFGALAGPMAELAACVARHSRS